MHIFPKFEKNSKSEILAIQIRHTQPEETNQTNSLMNKGK
jgi:hypothetical protein